jgi:hypothetical protein
MHKVHIHFRCTNWKAQAYLPHKEVEEAHSKPYIQHKPCPSCPGSGHQKRWIDMTVFGSIIDGST